MSYFNGRIKMQTIAKATNGDPESINLIIDFYANYIKYLSLKEMQDANGQIYFIVDNDVCRRLETKLIASILKYKLN